jgi:hypothetical protein
MMTNCKSSTISTRNFPHNQVSGKFLKHGGFSGYLPTYHPALRRLRSLRSLRSLRRLLRSLRSLGGLRALHGRASSWQVVSRDDVVWRFRCRRHRKLPG